MSLARKTFAKALLTWHLRLHFDYFDCERIKIAFIHFVSYCCLLSSIEDFAIEDFI